MDQALGHSILFDFSSIDPALEYYSFSRFERDGRFIQAVQSMWVGFSSGADPSVVELRRPSLVSATRIATAWARLGQPWMMVTSCEEWMEFVAIGGNALIESGFAQAELGDQLEPYEVRRTGPFGFDHVRPDDRAVLKHRVRPAQRHRVLHRDGHRCQCCHSAEGNGLTLHHVRMFANGGPTIEDNLITLCTLCHRSLDPHEDLSLFWLPNGVAQHARERERMTAHIEAAERYRLAMANAIERCSSVADTPPPGRP